MFGQGLRKIHTAWLQEQKEKEEEGQRNPAVEIEEHKEEEEENATVPDVSAEAKTSVVLVPRDISTTAIDIDTPSSISQDVRPLIFHDVESPSETFSKTCVDIPPTATSSPTLTISTVSDLAPTELDEEIEHSEEQTLIRHNTFYFEDGNVEIVCECTVFRVHSTVLSFSSSKLQDILSPSALLNAPMPEGRPRIALTDGAEDFGILLKMIYTPGYASLPDVGSGG